MVKMIRGFVPLALCIIVLFCVSMINNRRNDNCGEYGISLENMLQRRNRDSYFYMEKGKTKEINYVSYSVEIRENADAGGCRREVTFIRIVKK